MPAQPGGNWSAYTSRQDVYALLAVQGNTWAATGGGAVHIDGETGLVTAFTHLDGLARGGTTALVEDSTGAMWFGTAGGGLSRLRPEARRFDAPLTAFEDLQIHALAATGDELYVASDRGISLVSLQSLRVQQTYRQLGTFPRDTPVLALATHGGLLWAATDTGVASARLDGANLQDPDNWQADDSLGRVTALAQVQGQLMAAGVHGVWRYDGVSWRHDGGPSESVALLEFQGRMFVAAGDVIQVRTGDKQWLSYWSTRGRQVRALTVAGGVIQIGTEEGIESIGAGRVALGGPPANQFHDLSFDGNGTLWVASVPDDRIDVPRGAYSLQAETGVWRQYDTRTGLHNNTVVAVEAADDGTVWAGTWGGGLAVRDSNDTWNILSSNNSVLGGLDVPPAPSFVVIPDIATDTAGRVWMTNIQVGLVVLDGYPPQRSTRFEAAALGLPAAPRVGPVAIGADGLKWIGTPTNGLVLLDDGGTPFSTADDRSLNIRSLEYGELTSDNITCLVTHPAADGAALWVGTDDGLHRVTYSYSRESGFAVRRWRSYRLEHGLQSMSIRDLAVDGLGSVWAATGEGLTQLRATGALVHTFTTGNSGLVDDRALSVAFDPTSSSVWVGTLAGLSRLQVTGAAAPGAASDVLSFPNPFDPGRGATLTFSGLPLGVGVRVLTVDGTLVARVAGSPDGTATWDGQTLQGQTVASGVYFYVSDDGRFRGKIAVLRGRTR